MTESKRMHDVRVNQKADKVLFIFAFFVGVIGTFALKHYGFSSLWVAVVPAATLFVYAFTAWAWSRNIIEPDIIGDNCYYLGFIFTLISLAATLYSLAQTPDDIGMVREIVSGFGIALTSTITGIFLRAIFQQFRSDLVATERKARIELNDATRQFQVELSQSLKSMRSFSIEAQQMLNEYFDTLRKEETKHLTARDKVFEDIAQQAAKVFFDEWNQKTTEILNEVKSSFDDVNSQWVEQVTAVTDNIRIASTRYSESLIESAKVIELSVEKTNVTNVKLSESVSETFDILERSSNNLRITTDAQINKISQATSSIEQSSDGVISAFESSTSKIKDKIGDASELIAKEGFDVLDTLRSNTQSIIAEIDETRDSVEDSVKVLATYNKSISSIVDSTDGINKNLAETKKVIRSLNEELDDLSVSASKSDLNTKPRRFFGLLK